MTPEAQSRTIPEPIKREVRQRCGFGCVLCGLPIYDYDHMDGWAVTHVHDAQSITLLCDRHHRERTSGLLPIEAVRVADANPHNLRTGWSSQFALHFTGERCAITVGSNVASTLFSEDGDRLTALVIDDQEIVGFRRVDGQLLLNMNVFDDDNELVLRVEDSQLTHSADNWDITFVGRTLALREGRGQFVLEVEFQPPSALVIRRGRIVYNGIEVVITPRFLLLVNDQNLVSGNSSSGLRYGVAINSSGAQGVAFMFGGSSRVEVGSYDPERRREAIARAEHQLNSRTASGGVPYPRVPADSTAGNDRELARRIVEQWKKRWSM